MDNVENAILMLQNRKDLDYDTLWSIYVSLLGLSTSNSAQTLNVLGTKIIIYWANLTRPQEPRETKDGEFWSLAQLVSRISKESGFADRWGT